MCDVTCIHDFSCIVSYIHSAHHTKDGCYVLNGSERKTIGNSAGGLAERSNAAVQAVFPGGRNSLPFSRLRDY